MATSPTIALEHAWQKLMTVLGQTHSLTWMDGQSLIHVMDNRMRKR